MNTHDRAYRTGTVGTARRDTAAQLVEQLPELHREVLTAALRSPSAHNAQPWRIRPVPTGGGWRYELHYDHHEYLPADPDDRDAYLCMGAFCETLALAADHVGLRAEISRVLTRRGSDLHVADVALAPRDPREQADPLAAYVAGRATNRSVYTSEPLPPSLVARLEALGCRLVPTTNAARVVARASTLSWRDRRLVSDLDAWVRPDPHSPDGMTPRQLGLARYEWVALKAAFVLGRIRGPLARVYGAREVRLMRDAPAVAVVCAETDAPQDLVDAGRRLLRAWVTICGAGFGYHPISIAIDREETRPWVASLVKGAGTPVAMFRVGRPTAPAASSNRVDLEDVVIADRAG
jgi:hypothetical protein